MVLLGSISGSAVGDWRPGPKAGGRRRAAAETSAGRVSRPSADRPTSPRSFEQAAQQRCRRRHPPRRPSRHQTPFESPPGPASCPRRLRPIQHSRTASVRTIEPTGPADGGADTDPASPLEGFAVKLKAAPLEPTDVGLPINLATALRLSDARPLIVAAAQASVWVAEAQLTRAKVLWVPQLNFGGDYIRHDGGGPDFNKGILTAPSVNFFYGGGGLWEIVALTDVFFEPLVKRQMLNSRQADIQTAKNDAALMTATTYFDVHQHRGMYAGALYCVERGRDLVERIASLSNELVPDSRSRTGQEPARRPRAASHLRASSVAGLERPAHPGLAAQPAGGRRPARARSSPGHLDRPRPAASRPACDRPDQPPRARLVPGARSGGRGADPPRARAHAPAHRPGQRLPDSRRNDSSRGLRHRHQQQTQPVGRP